MSVKGKWWNSRGYVIVSDSGPNGEPGIPFVHHFFSTEPESAWQEIKKLQRELPANLTRNIRVTLARISFSDAEIEGRGWLPDINVQR